MKWTGGRLRQVREEKGFTLCDLAAAADITPTTLSYYERGVREPGCRVFYRIAETLGERDIRWLAGVSENREGSQEWAEALLMNQTGAEYRGAKEEWTRDEYEDFFNADAGGRKRLLRMKGVPSFTGYGVVPGDANEADFALLCNTFRKLNEYGKGIAVGRLLELAENPEYRGVFGKPKRKAKARR